jgi:hypothetical protein
LARLLEGGRRQPGTDSKRRQFSNRHFASYFQILPDRICAGMDKSRSLWIKPNSRRIVFCGDLAVKPSAKSPQAGQTIEEGVWRMKNSGRKRSLFDLEC